MTETVRFCRSRNAGRRCTRPLDHPGLHRHRTIMWADAAADPPHCPGSHAPASPAEPGEGGYPHGRGLCRQCLRFVPIEGGELVDHDTTDPDEPAEESTRRRDWFNRAG